MSLKFFNIPKPKIVALYSGNGSGTKLFQGYLDQHPEIYMIPGYPLLYFYPHWFEWHQNAVNPLTWPDLIKLFCVKHASVIDSRKFQSHDGLANLGKEKDKYLCIDEIIFKDHLSNLLADENVTSNTFLLAIHYAYCLTLNEDIAQKTTLVYHIHSNTYIKKYLLNDFPDAKVIGFVRDPRSNIAGRYNHSMMNVDKSKLNVSDAFIYRKRPYFFSMEYLLNGLQELDIMDFNKARVIRHEDIYFRLDEVLQATINFIGLSDHPLLKQCTYGGHSWWGDNIFKQKLRNTCNPSVVQQTWQETLPKQDWFVLEGLLADYLDIYGYKRLKFNANNPFNLLKLKILQALPLSYERAFIYEYLSPTTIIHFIKAAFDEGFGRKLLKDYTFNAYYRHKWSNLELNLWEPSIASKWVKKIHGDENNISFKEANGIEYYACGIFYTFDKIIRYILSIMTIPVIVWRRWKLCSNVLKRRINVQTVLPRTLPDNGTYPSLDI